jgi:hypothetical protein
MPMLAVQSAVQPRDIPIANVIYLVFQLLGPSVFITVAQTILLNDLLPRLRVILPNITQAEVLNAGATGFQTEVPALDLPSVLQVYATSLDKVFVMTSVVAAVATFVACGVEWKSIKKGNSMATNGKEKSDAPLGDDEE